MNTDPIADYLTRIRNANSAGHKVVSIPASNVKKEITKILFDQGYILSYKFEDDTTQGSIKIALKYNMLIILDHLTFWRETPNQASQRSKLSFKGQFEQIETDLFFLELAFKSKLLSKNEEKKAKEIEQVQYDSNQDITLLLDHLKSKVEDAKIARFDSLSNYIESQLFVELLTRYTEKKDFYPYMLKRDSLTRKAITLLADSKSFRSKLQVSN